MIKCNLAVLLAERGLKLTTVSNDTGISRTTLTALANNKNSGIQFDTLNTLCIYLRVKPDQFFVFVPMDIKIINSSFIHENTISIEIEISNVKKSTYFLIVDFSLAYKEYEKKTFFNNIVDIDMEVSLPIYFNDKIYTEENKILLYNFEKLSPIFKNELRENIVEKVISLITEREKNLKNYTISPNFDWGELEK